MLRGGRYLQLVEPSGGRVHCKVPGLELDRPLAKEENVAGLADIVVLQQTGQQTAHRLVSRQNTDWSADSLQTGQ